jgi:hypothetical protein
MTARRGKMGTGETKAGPPEGRRKGRWPGILKGGLTPPAFSTLNQVVIATNFPI